MGFIFGGPKITPPPPPLPPPTPPMAGGPGAVQAGAEEGLALDATQNETLLTGGQGVSPTSVNTTGKKLTSQ